MVTVPRTQQSVVARPGPTTRSTPVFQNGNTSAASFGAGLAQANAQLGQSIASAASTGLDIITKEQIEDNEREAKRLDVLFSQRLREINYGDGKTSGFYGTRGTATLEALPDTEKAINDARREISQSVKNQAVRGLFDRSASVRQERELETMVRFTSDQRRVANDATSEARLGEAADDAAVAWNDPQVLARSITIAASEVDDMAERNGWSPEVAASKMQEAETHIYRTAIVAALQQDPDAAQTLYNRNKTQIDGRVRPEIEKLLETGVIRKQSQEAADQITALFPNDIDGARKAARGITKAKLRDEVLTRVNARHNEQRQLLSEIRADEEFKRAAQDRALVERSQEMADTLYSNSGSAAAAIATAENLLAGKERDAVVKRLTDMYERDRKLAATDRPAHANTTAMDIAKASKSEEEALKAAADIEDPLLKADVEQQLRTMYADQRRADDARLTTEAQDLAAAILKSGLSEPAQLAKARDELDGKLEASVVAELNKQHAEVVTQRNRDKSQASASAFQFVWGGGSISAWQSQNPERFELLASDGSLLTSLQAAERNVAMGRLFASASDGATLNNLRALDTADLARVNLDEVRSQLTQSEFEKASNLVKAATARMDAIEADQTMYDRAEAVLKDFAPRSLRWGLAKASRDQVAQRQTAINEMGVFIDSFTREGKKPTVSEIRSEAQRLMLQIEADPSGLFNQFEGIGAQASQLTPAQLAVARVDEDDIPQAIMAEIVAEFKRVGVEPTSEQIEQFAGALATNNRARARAILGRQ